MILMMILWSSRMGIKDWHRADIFSALTERGWDGPSSITISPEHADHVGEAYEFKRNNETVEIYLVADSGTGLNGPRSMAPTMNSGCIALPIRSGDEH